jgi:hypothetical protein
MICLKTERCVCGHFWQGLCSLTSGPLSDVKVDPEALTFWAFSGLMAEFLVNYAEDLDPSHSSGGVQGESNSNPTAI